MTFLFLGKKLLFRQTPWVPEKWHDCAWQTAKLRRSARAIKQVWHGRPSSSDTRRASTRHPWPASWRSLLLWLITWHAISYDGRQNECMSLIADERFPPATRLAALVSGDKKNKKKTVFEKYGRSSRKQQSVLVRKLRRRVHQYSPQKGRLSTWKTPFVIEEYFQSETVCPFR